MADMDLDDVPFAGGIDADELDTQPAPSVDASISRARDADAALVAALESRKTARSLAVPTDDAKVRQRLRQLGQPVTLFGERRPDRRERLREELVKEAQRREQEGEEAESVVSEESEEEEQEEEFFTEGTDALLRARQSIARTSLVAAKARVARQRVEATVPLSRIVAQRKALFEPLKHFTSLGSQIGDTRPISVVRFSPGTSTPEGSGRLLAGGSWSGSVKLWEVPAAKERTTLRGHTEKVGGIAWHPQATKGLDASAANLVTGAGDATVQLWSLTSDRPLATLKGHEARVARTAWHPSGAYVASASFDGTWRLWDVEKQSELLLQEGHSKEVYAIDFQDDGALVASGGLDAIGRVWDLRTGRTAMVLDGHAREILSIDFAPNGFQVATASGDDTVRVWDMRALRSISTIPAHRSSVADVRFFRAADEGAAARGSLPDEDKEANGDAKARGENGDAAAAGATLQLPRSGMYLATAGYDGFVRVWSADDFACLRSLSGDAGKVMSVDISPDGKYLASGEWGRTWKLWGVL